MCVKKEIQTRSLSQNVTNAPELDLTPNFKNVEVTVQNKLCTALLLTEIYLPIKFHVNALHRFKVMLRTKFMYENQQRAITSKI